MIEVKNERYGVTGVLAIRGEILGATQYMNAHARDVAAVVAAGDPLITSELRKVGWVDAAKFLESVVMPTATEAGAELLHAASEVVAFLDDLSIEETSELEHSQRLQQQLQEAIDNYTDNVAPPDDEEAELPRSAFVTISSHPIIQPEAVTKRLDVTLPIGLWMRDVLPDEVNEDPKPNPLQYLEPGEHVVLPKEEFNKLTAKQGATFDHLFHAVRALVVCLDSDVSDWLQDPLKLVERLGELVRERDKAAHEAEHAMTLMLTQMGRETLARVEADRQRDSMRAGYENAHQMREGVMRETEEKDRKIRSLERRLKAALAKLSPGEVDDLEGRELKPDNGAGNLDLEAFDRATSPQHRAGGITGEEFAAGAAAVGKVSGFTPVGFPPPGTPEGDMFGSVVARGGFWLLDKLWPRS